MKPARSRKAAARTSGSQKPAPAPKAKSGAKSRQRAAAASPPDARRLGLEKELRAAIGQVDEKGLIFLLRQAQVLIHNARVESLQRSSDAESDLTGPIPVLQGAPDQVTIEKSGSGKPIFLSLGRVRKIMSAEEMKRLVRICYGAATRSEAVQQLFTVLLRERKDILTDAVIGGPDNPLMIGLFNAVRESYHLEDR